MEGVLAGPFRLEGTGVGDERRWVAAFDTTHPAISAPPEIPSYPLDEQWRVTARFDRFDSPKRVRVPDVRGGSMEVTAFGQLTLYPARGDLQFAIGAIAAEGDGLWRKALELTRGALERDGLVAIGVGADRRERQVDATAKGRRSFTKAMPLWQSAQSAVARKMDRNVKEVNSVLLRLSHPARH